MSEPKLFTPGPLTTSRTVKEAMLVDLGSREVEFIELVRAIRAGLLALADGTADHEAVLLQGSGTYAIESVISSAIPSDGKILVLANGVYGERIATIAERHGIATEVLRTPVHEPPTASVVREALATDAAITHVALVHCETTTGILNPLTEIGAEVRAAGKTFLVDAMSSFGGIPISLPECGADFLISSSNKCLEGVPGFAFVLARRTKLAECEGRARTISLDLHAQWAGLEKNGQFRFTPPTHAMLAFARALEELTAEGWIAARNRRYQENQSVLVEGMRRLGFRTLIDSAHQSPIITTFHDPADPAFSFEAFHDALKARGCAIYPGKIGGTDAFRVGSVGHIDRGDIEALLVAVAETIDELGITL